mmetsp:Transcript_55409/g.127390  ORF Transcript_55409/g.127390 Transcript_55409/m.127390 type:complete len:337 (-) Transcript_55409:4-1014(-)
MRHMVHVQQIPPQEQVRHVPPHLLGDCATDGRRQLRRCQGFGWVGALHSGASGEHKLRQVWHQMHPQFCQPCSNTQKSHCARRQIHESSQPPVQEPRHESCSLLRRQRVSTQYILHGSSAIRPCPCHNQSTVRHDHRHTAIQSVLHHHGPMHELRSQPVLHHASQSSGPGQSNDCVVMGSPWCQHWQPRRDPLLDRPVGRPRQHPHQGEGLCHHLHRRSLGGCCLRHLRQHLPTHRIQGGLQRLSTALLRQCGLSRPDHSLGHPRRASTPTDLLGVAHSQQRGLSVPKTHPQENPPTCLPAITKPSHKPCIHITALQLLRNHSCQVRHDEDTKLAT